MEQTRLLSEADVEREYSIKRGTLRAYRARKMGPPFVRLGKGRLVRYRISDIEAWIEASVEGGGR